MAHSIEMLKRGLVCLALSLPAVGCAASEPAPAREPKPTLYNAKEEPAGGSHEADLEQMRAAQVRFSTALGVALRIGAAIYVTQHEKCPTVDEVVAAKLVSADLRTEDAWGKTYRITCPPAGPIVTSAGPDGVFETADDIVSGK